MNIKKIERRQIAPTLTHIFYLIFFQLSKSDEPSLLKQTTEGGVFVSILTVSMRSNSTQQPLPWFFRVCFLAIIQRGCDHFK